MVIRRPVQCALGLSDRRRRHGLDARIVCYLCNAADESCDHLLFECSFTQRVWDGILAPMRLDKPSTTGCGSVLEWRRCLRELWPASVRRGGDSLFTLVTWQVWKERNARCFQGETSTVNYVVSSIRSGAGEWVRAGARALGCIIRE
ncbi:hypothetical protein BS78_04G082500 [Paspalum vaginatum]|nr:hypothetical protein BS78_04G082500 [Paspalum vaginatum]